MIISGADKAFLLQRGVYRKFFLGLGVDEKDLKTYVLTIVVTGAIFHFFYFFLNFKCAGTSSLIMYIGNGFLVGMGICTTHREREKFLKNKILAKEMRAKMKGAFVSCAHGVNI